MPQTTSLDELIAKKAAEYADQIRAAAAMAANEEEIRIESEKQLAFIQREAGIKLEGRHEFTVASGRVDSVYSRVIIEYKNPKSAGDRIGPKADSPGSKKVVEQIKKRFYDMRHEHGQPMNSLFGVGLDGNHFIFIRFRDDKWQVQDPVEVNRVSAERFLWALFNLGSKGKAFSPEYLAGDFGSEGSNTIAVKGIHALYDAIVTTDNPKAQTFFSQWKLLFGEVCGYDVDTPSDKIKKLAEFYQVGVKDPKPAELLFAVHTYYALFMKLLAVQIMTKFHRLPLALERMMTATTSNKLKREMDDLEAGSIFRHLNITNFLEGDLFAWYTGVWTEPIEKLVREMVTRLDEYNPGTLSEDPAGSRDLLKKLYQQLFPKSVRHDLGEYYTPDWLAEHVLDELGYVGDPDKRLLDPACGSGTFLVMAINRVRKWYDENRERCRYDEGDLCRKLLANVIGFDLNPLAVMAARTNYLIAIRDLIGQVDEVEIPIYLCDSILTPAEYADLFIGTGKTAKVPCSACKPPHLLVPKEIAKDRVQVAKYAHVIEESLRVKRSPDEFLQACADEALQVSDASLHKILYDQLRALDQAQKNGVWARIIKNAFAPLFIEKVDYVAGNPPWVRWGDLPKVYRDQTKALWIKHGLFTQKGLASRMGTAELDISMLFLYACLDFYAEEKAGKIGFLITQECIRSKSAGAGFRRFALESGARPFKVLRFDDFSAMQPFEASNKTAVIFCGHGEGTQYPVRYVKWQSKAKNKDLKNCSSWQEAKDLLTCRSLQASPIDSELGPWQVSEAGQSSALAKLKGRCDYAARRGADLEPYGVYFVKVLSEKRSELIVENAPELGKRDIVKLGPTAVEDEYIFPALRGSDIGRWIARPEYAVFVLNRSTRHEDIPSEESLRKDFPKTYEYFLGFRDVLLSRGSNIARALAENTSFFAAFGVGHYTFAPVKVIWQRMAAQMKAVVVTTSPELLPNHVVIPTATTSFISFPSQGLDEAHYVCALLNSTPGRTFFASYSSAGRGFGAPSLIKQLRLPNFEAAGAVGRSLAGLSKEAHRLASLGESLTSLEDQIDKLSATLWELSEDELTSLNK